MASLFNRASANPLQSDKSYPVRADEIARIERAIKMNTAKLIETTPSFTKAVKAGMKDNRLLAVATIAIASGAAIIASGIGAEVSGIANDRLIERIENAGTAFAGAGISLASAALAYDAASRLKNTTIQLLYAKSVHFQDKMNSHIDNLIADGVDTNTQEGSPTTLPSQLPTQTLIALESVIQSIQRKPVTSAELGAIISSRMHQAKNNDEAAIVTEHSISSTVRAR